MQSKWLSVSSASVKMQENQALLDCRNTPTEGMGFLMGLLMVRPKFSGTAM